AMGRTFLHGILLALPACVAVATAAEARQAYCYLTVMPSGDKFARAVVSPTIHVTPVFTTDADVYLLAARFQENVAEGGLATCITDDDGTDLVADRKNFIDSSTGNGFVVKDEVPPSGD